MSSILPLILFENLLKCLSMKPINRLDGLELVEKTRWLSNTKRVSKYCIEGERGLISNCGAGENYINNLKKQMEELEWI